MIFTRRLRISASRRASLWYSDDVRLASTFCALFYSLAVAGLLFAPLARPAMGAPASLAAAGSMNVDAMSGGMSDPMPCCPDEAPASDCGKVCPLMALCSVASCQNLPSATALIVVFRLTGIAVPPNDMQVSSLATGPPRRPPKT